MALSAGRPRDSIGAMMQQPEPGRDQENVSGWLVDGPEGDGGRASLGAPSPLLRPPQPASPSPWSPAATPLAERQPSSVPGDPPSYASPKSEHLCFGCAVSLPTSYRHTWSFCQCLSLQLWAVITAKFVKQELWSKTVPAAAPPIQA